MPIGPTVRRMFGPYEHHVSDAYRSVFIDLDHCLDRIQQWAPDARRILEVGCGEGAMTERLCRRYPRAQILAIDVTDRVGRLFRGDAARVEFRKAPVEAVAAAEPQAFDLVLLSDVLHHVPVPLRGSLLQAIKTALAPRGVFVFKEWSRSRTPIHWMCEASDRLLTGDDVSYLDRAEVRALLGSTFGAGAVRDECTVKPWRNNIAMLVRPEAV